MQRWSSASAEISSNQLWNVDSEEKCSLPVHISAGMTKLLESKTAPNIESSGSCSLAMPQGPGPVTAAAAQH
jgi:hypothetical protein